MTADRIGVPTEADRPGPPRWQRPFRFVGTLLAKVYVEPVLQDRLRMINWPRGLPLLAAITTAGYATAMVIAAATPWLRSRLPMDLVRSLETVGVPAGLPWLLIALLAVAAVILQTGALHAARWLRIAMLCVSLSLMLTVGAPPASGLQVFVGVGFWLVLVIFQAIRWRAAFRWWEYAVVAGCFGLPMVIASGSLARIRVYGTGPSDWVATVMPNIALLAAPLTLVAGYAIAQWAFSTVVWAVDLGRRQLPRWVLITALVLLLVWRLGAELINLGRAILNPALLLVPVGLLVGGLVVWTVLDKLADRAGPGSTRLADLGEDLRSVALPVAFVYTAGDVLFGVLGYPLSTVGLLVDVLKPFLEVVQVVSDFLRGDIFTVIAFLGLLGWAVRLALRAQRGRSELVGLMALFFLAMRFYSAADSVKLMGVWVTLGVLVLFLGLLITGRLRGRRIEGMLLVAGLATVLSTRSFFADPINAVLGGSAALLLSLVWQFLTGGSDANGDSPGFPRPARVLLVLGFNLLAMVAVSFYRLSMSSEDLLDTYQTGGDRVLGGALLLGSVLAAALAVLRDEQTVGTAVDDASGTADGVDPTAPGQPGNTVRASG